MKHTSNRVFQSICLGLGLVLACLLLWKLGTTSGPGPSGIHAPASASRPSALADLNSGAEGGAANRGSGRGDRRRAMELPARAKAAAGLSASPSILVLDQLGTPTPSVRLLLVRAGGRRHLATSNAKGRANFAGGPVRLRAALKILPPFVAIDGDLHIGHGTENPLRVSVLLGCTLVGRVTRSDGSSPPPDMSIELRVERPVSRDAAQPVPWTTERVLGTDPGGHYRVQGLLPGPKRIILSARAGSSLLCGEHRVRLPPEGATTLDMPLPQDSTGLLITSGLRDHQGAPLSAGLFLRLDPPPSIVIRIRSTEPEDPSSVKRQVILPLGESLSLYGLDAAKLLIEAQANSDWHFLPEFADLYSTPMRPLPLHLGPGRPSSACLVFEL